MFLDRPVNGINETDPPFQSGKPGTSEYRWSNQRLVLWEPSVLELKRIDHEWLLGHVSVREHLF